MTVDNEYIDVQWRGCGAAELWPLKPLLKMYKFNNLELYGCGGLVTTGAVAASLLFSSASHHMLTYQLLVQQLPREHQ